MSDISIFKRVEKKYLLTVNEYNELMNTIKKYIVLDQYGRHTICNIYYDSWQDELARNSFQKPVYKEKLRIRAYSVPKNDSKVFVELKKKYDGIVYKRRVSIIASELNNYLNNKHLDNSQIGKEIHYFINHYKVIPKMFMAYEREAYTALDNNNLRITFDQNIRSRLNDLDLLLGDHGKFLFEEQKYLMEIKTTDAYPRWLVNALNKNHIYPASFSKYNNVYKKYYQGGYK